MGCGGGLAIRCTMNKLLKQGSNAPRYKPYVRVFLDSMRKHGLTSEYGSKDPREAFAEAIAKTYEQGADAGEFSKALVQTSQELLRLTRSVWRLARKGPAPRRGD